MSDLGERERTRHGDPTEPLEGDALFAAVTHAMVALHERHNVGPDLEVELFFLADTP